MSVSPIVEVTLRLGRTEAADLVTFLIDGQAQQVAWAKARHTTEAERQACLRMASILQSVQAQVEGWEAKPEGGAPDWGAGDVAEAIAVAEPHRAAMDAVAAVDRDLEAEALARALGRHPSGTEL